MSSVMKVVQCWDDGVTTDIRAIEILRKHKAKATFNLNAGLCKDKRYVVWNYKGTDVSHVSLPELREVYEGFVIANHTLTHPHLEQIPLEKARYEIVEGRARLEEIFEKPVLGFVYPYGSYNAEVKEVIRELGYVYARTAGKPAEPFPPKDPMEFHPHCHFLEPDFWARYEQARASGWFYFWGHTYEIINDDMWRNFDEQIARISNDTAAQWLDVVDLFAK